MPALLETYREMMTPATIAAELENSAVYVRERIGSAKYRHLSWVNAIARLQQVATGCNRAIGATFIQHKRPLDDYEIKEGNSRHTS